MSFAFRAALAGFAALVAVINSAAVAQTTEPSTAPSGEAVQVPAQEPTTEGEAHTTPEQAQPAESAVVPAVTVTQSNARPRAKKKLAKKPTPTPGPAPQPASQTISDARAAPSNPPDAATSLGFYDPANDIEGLVLPSGVTITTAGPVDGYRALSAVSATKTATPIEQLPQSIQVVPRSVIDDQVSLTVTEALQNVSNVQGVNDINIGNTDLQPLTIRGFTAEQWLDGLVVNYNAGDRDSFANVERIEVLKGPNAILYGGGPGAPVGGAINVISKLPTNRASAESGVIFGSEDYVRPYFDINQPLTANGTVLFRLTGDYNSASSFIDVLESERYSIYPTLTITDKVNTNLTIQGRFSRFEQQGYQGLPVVGTVAGDFRIDPHLYIGPRDITPSTSEVESLTATFDHRFNQVWSGNIKARWSHSEFDQNTQTTVFGSPPFDFGFPDIGPSQWEIINSEVAQEQDEFTINPNLIARFGWGPTSNTFLLGGDYSRVTDEGHHFTNNLGNYCYVVLFACTPPTTVDLLDPKFPIPYVDPTPLNSGDQFTTYGDIDNVYTTQGVYTQLQTSLLDRIHLMAGVRVAQLKVDYVERAFETMGLGPVLTFTTDETKPLPRAGAVVDLFKGLSIYGSYSEGMRWAGFGVQNNPADTKPEPEQSEQYEAGFKFAVAPGFSGTVAVFQIERLNVPATVGIGDIVFTDQRSRGFETDLIWQPNSNWKVIGSYGFVDAVFLTDSNAGAAGDKIPEVPEHSGRLWVKYAFDPGPLKGWSIGAGVYAASDQFVDTANQFSTPGYFTVDATIGYDTERFAAALNIKNLTDEDYFVPYPWFGGQVAPGPERAYYGTVRYKF